MDLHSTFREPPGSRHDALRPEPLGAHLGRYPVVGPLGVGGMGSVLRVTDPSLGRDMAAKVAHDGVSNDAATRFVREARVMGRLEHPGIPPVHELGVAPDGRTFFTMKCVAGQDLAAIVAGLRERERLAEPSPAAITGATLTELLEIFLKVTDAVAFAHSQRVIHRDLKPANVMVGAFGEVLVMDWGLARALDADSNASDDAWVGSPATASDSTVDPNPSATQDGTILGTPGYMPPEQASGEISALDERADLYALGALLYELLTLAPPYEGPTGWAVLDLVLAGPPVPPRMRAPHRAIPWELEAIVLRAMARDPADRYLTAGALRSDVVAYLEGRRVRAAHYGLMAALGTWARAHRRVLAGAGIVLVTSTLVLAALALERRRTRSRLLDRAARAEAAGDVQRALDALDDGLAGYPDDVGVTELKVALITRAADRALAAAAPPDELAAAWRARLEAVRGGEPERPEPPAVLSRREAHVDRYLAATVWLERAARPVALDVTRRSLVAGEGLAWAALLGRDYTLVRQAVAGLRRVGGEGLAVAMRLESAAHEDRTARIDLWRRRADIAASDVIRGLGRDGRAPGAPQREDYVVELAGYRHPDVAAELGRLLDERLVALVPARGASHPWSQPERDLAHVLVHALGRLQIPESVPPLARWLAATSDPALAVEAGIALCNTRRPEAEPPLLAAQERWGINSEPWRQVGRFLARVPTSTGSMPSTTAELLARGQLRFSKGDVVGALADYDLAIALGPPDTIAFAHRATARQAANDLDGALSDFDRAITLDPTNAIALNNRGTARRAKHDTSGALADFDRALAVDPAYTSAYVNRARVRETDGDIAGAIEDLDRAIELDPRAASALNNRGALRRAQGNTVGALADYDRAIELDPRLTSALFNRGTLRDAMGNAKGAVADFDRAIELDPRLLLAFIHRGNSRLAQGDTTGAIADFGAAIAVDPRDALGYTNRGRAREVQGDLDGALVDLDRSIELDQTRGIAYAYRGHARRAKGDRSGALADFDRAIALDPRDARAFDGRGSTRMSLSDLEGARADFDQAIALDPRLAGAFANRSNLRFMAGDLDGALADADVAIALDSACALAYVNRGNARDRRGDSAGALADYDHAIALDPRQADAFLGRGLVRKSMGDLDGALVDVNQALAVDPRHARAFNNRGTLRQQRGDLDGAIADFDRAIELDASLWRPWANRALALAKSNRRAEAIAAVARALALAPSADRARLEALRQQLSR